MDSDLFAIYVDRLRSGQSYSFSLSPPANFLDVDEKECFFRGEVQIDGEAYLAQSDLIIAFTATAECWLPCAVCNQMTPSSLFTGQVTEVVSSEEIHGGVYSFNELVREAIVVQIPTSVECGGRGLCPERKEMERYLHKEDRLQADLWGDGSSDRSTAPKSADRENGSTVAN